MIFVGHKIFFGCFFYPITIKKKFINSQLLGKLSGSWIWCSGPNLVASWFKKTIIISCWSSGWCEGDLGTAGGDALGQWKLRPGDFASGSGSSWFQPLTRWSIWSPCVFILGFRPSGCSSWGRRFPWPRHAHKAASPVVQSISGTMLATVPLARASHVVESKINTQENILFSDRNCAWREFGVCDMVGR